MPLEPGAAKRRLPERVGLSEGLGVVAFADAELTPDLL